MRFEVPSRYRHFSDVTMRYARWDLGRVDLADPRSGTILAPLYPLDRSANADGRRSLVETDNAGAPADVGSRAAHDLPPLLKRILEEYSATGMPPAYLPKHSHPKPGEAS